jgi:hypothetical protein
MTAIGMVGVNTSHADQFLRILNGSHGEPPVVPDSPVTIRWGSDDDAYVFHLTACGAKGHASMEISDALGFYSGEMRAFAEMVRTGMPPIPAARTLDVLAILKAGERSAERGEGVEIAEIAGVTA